MESRLISADVTIIGSGPAGCAAAISCVQAGLRVALVTNKQLNERIDEQTLSTAASESVHPGILSLLEKLNAGEIIGVASRGIYEGIKTVKGYTPLGSDENGAWLGNHINRHVFDSALLQCASRQGVNIVSNETVDDLVMENDAVTGIKTNAGTMIRSAYTIDASGYKRIAGKKLALKEKFLSPPLAVWTGYSIVDDIKKYTFKRPVTEFIPNPSGWTWLAPELPDRCTWTRLERKGKHDLTQPPELINYTVTGAIKAFNMRWRVFRPVCKNGLLLCGDAAGILDPAAGQGILNAIMSGMMAAQTVHTCLQEPAHANWHLANYDYWFVEQYEKKANQLKQYYAEQGIML